MSHTLQAEFDPATCLGLGVVKHTAGRKQLFAAWPSDKIGGGTQGKQEKV